MEREAIMIIVKAKFVSNFKLRIGTSSVEMPLIKTNSYPKTPPDSWSLTDVSSFACFDDICFGIAKLKNDW